MWTVLYVSQSVETSKRLVEVLLKNKVISKLRRVSGKEDGECYEVLVPSTELECAQDLVFGDEMF